jgi:predicted Zn-dependent protease
MAVVGIVTLSAAVTCLGCAPGEGGGGEGGGAGEGPGRRAQRLALTPEQELKLGQQAYKEVLNKPDEYGPALPPSSREVQRVRHIADKIIKVSQIEPLQREINLRVKGYTFDWHVNVLQSKQINAFCLPAGYMFVFTGLLPVAENDDQLATVMSHEISHALAHHSSERIARSQRYNEEIGVIGKVFGGMPEGERRQFMGVLAAGAGLRSKSYDRKQESEADHIGVFLMTFAGYDPEQAIAFWRNMERISARRGRPPTILSDHPSDAQRLRDIAKWIPYAKKALEAYKRGDIAPPRRR